MATPKAAQRSSPSLRQARKPSGITRALITALIARTAWYTLTGLVNQ
jgi:hypothetical protein